jgi:molybdopterin synthase sulfur carrier subunit
MIGHKLAGTYRSGSMQVRVFGTLRTVVGNQKHIDVRMTDGASAGELLHELILAYPALERKVLRQGGELRGGVSIFVNGRSVRFLDGLDTAIHEGDEVALFPPVGGG